MKARVGLAASDGETGVFEVPGVNEIEYESTGRRKSSVSGR